LAHSLVGNTNCELMQLLQLAERWPKRFGMLRVLAKERFRPNRLTTFDALKIPREDRSDGILRQIGLRELSGHGGARFFFQY
jgi:hypothetical protein